MRYDIEERTKDWLVSGQKTGEFVAEVSLPQPLDVPSRTDGLG